MSARAATLTRQTSETDIRLMLDLDGSGRHAISTGVGFYDHMLAAFAVHGLFDLDIQAAGDLHIDAHHTIEDVAIILGQAIDQALGDRAGINRAGHCYYPMDEALALIAVDISGRPYCVFQAEWRAPAIGAFPTDLVQHVFETLAVHARLTLHARVEYGRDDHHKAEALFKALARALRMAVDTDPRRAGVPSTKGTLTK